MKKLLLLLALSLCSFASWAQAYDFAAEAPSGQTLYYKILEPYSNPILSGNPDAIPAVQVVAPNAWLGYDAPTGALTIPRTVTYNDITYYVVEIGSLAFYDCTGLTSVTIPSSVDNIDAHAFLDCSGLIYVVFGASPEDSEEVENININDSAFAGCILLKTIYSLYPQDCTSGKFERPERVITASSITVSGWGANSVYLIDDYYYIEYDNEGWGLIDSQLTTPSLPTNFIAMRQGSLFAREIVLTDGKDEFKAPVEFTAAKATYTRSYTQSHRSTLCLPFKPSNVSSTGNLKFYEFSDFDGATIFFREVDFDDFEDNTPYMVEWPATKAQADFLFSASNVTIPATNRNSLFVQHNNGYFFGTTARTCMTDNNYGYKDGFFVQSANETGSFWGDEHSTHAHVNPFRAYFYFRLNQSDAPQSQPPHTLSVAFGDGPLAIDAVEAPATNGSIRYSNDVYDLMGRLVRKDAATLDGLPTGIYIWKGRKVLAK